MNWLTNFIRPKIRSFVQQKDVPDNLWTKCPSCEGMLFHRDLEESLNVCYHCDHHMRIDVEQRLELLFDKGQYKEIKSPKVAYDPLKFKDRKKYSDRLKEYRTRTGRDDAIVVAKGTIGKVPTIVAAFDFSFMGGSMGAAVGEGIVLAAHTAVKEKAALLVVPASGGARMQEGAISLMQMPRTIVAVEQVRKAGLPYLVLLTDPTTGGVSASFAMIGDIHLAEPGSTIGFAGKRVIQETIREELPEGFQTAEYLKDHGMVDIVVHRNALHDTLARIFTMLMNKPAPETGSDHPGKSNRSGLTKSADAEAAGAAKLSAARSVGAAATAEIGKQGGKTVKKTEKNKSGHKAIAPANDIAPVSEDKEADGRTVS